MSLKRKLLNGFVAVAAASSLAVLAAPASAEAAKRKCGYISCTWYFNTSETSDIKDGIGIGAIPIAFIPGVGPVTAASMGISSGTLSIMLNHHQCLKVKIGPGTDARVHAFPGFYTCP